MFTLNIAPLSDSVPVKQTNTGAVSNFQPRQIVCLEYETTYLYSEVIQTVTERQMCWVRPLMLQVESEDRLYDLRSGADLILSATLFRPALDTEVIPLLIQLEALPTSTNAHQQLSSFIRQVWQAHN